jgi:hypothetical protein
MSWELQCPPTFDNQLSTLDWEGPWAKMTLEKTTPSDPRHPNLEVTFERDLASYRPSGAEKTVASRQA